MRSQIRGFAVKTDESMSTSPQPECRHVSSPPKSPISWYIGNHEITRDGRSHIPVACAIESRFSAMAPQWRARPRGLPVLPEVNCT
jgi:hypothetical protein